MKLKLSTPFARKQKKASKQSVGEGRRRKRRLSSAPLTFLIFFALASGFWLLNRMQTKLSRDLRIPISLEELPPAYMISNFHFKDTITLRVQDVGFQQVRYELNEFQPIVLPLRYTKDNKPYLALSKDELRQEIMTRLSSSAVVQRQNIESYYLLLKARRRKKLAVELNADIAVASGYTMVKQTLIPDSVLVYGEQSVLKKLKTVKTELCEVKDVKNTLDRKLQLKLPYGVHSQTNSVLFNVEVEELTEQVFTCPIRKLNVPKGIKMIALPSNVVVRMTLPRSYHSKLREADIVPFIDYQKVAESKDGELSELEVKLIDYPKFIQGINIEPKQVQFVIEKG